MQPDFPPPWPASGPTQPDGAPPSDAPPGMPPLPPDYHFPPPSQHPYLPYSSYPPYAYYPPPALPPQGPFKRTFSVVDGADDAPLSGPVHKRVRHCVKCGSSECKGKGGRSFCQNKCQDCGKLDCKGRNSKKPDRTCADAWT